MQKKITEFIAYNYPNATEVKFKNKRISVEDIGNNNIGISFKYLCPIEEINIPSSSHRVDRGKIKVTNISVSKEAAFALYKALSRQLSHILMTEK